MRLPLIESLDLRTASSSSLPAANRASRNLPAPAIGRRKARRTRGFGGADTGGLFAGFPVSSTSIDHDLVRALRPMRARSRHLAQNDGYMKKFMWLLAQNVVGPRGVALQVKSGDARANAGVEAAWKKWARPEHASVTSKLSWVDIQRLMIWAVARDGEFLAYRHRGRNVRNPFGYAVQVLDADYLDEEINQELSGGYRIRMGVEMDPYGRPVAYHVRTRHPGDYQASAIWGLTHRRIPAEDVFHLFLAERPEQTRGIPWVHAAMKRLYQLGEYELCEVVASRWGASKMGFFQSKTGDQMPGVVDDEEEEEDGGEGALVMDMEGGKLFELPDGLEFKGFDPTHPNQAFSDFVKAMLRGVSGSLGVAFSSLASNLENVNFSSIRQGILEERDFWMMLQGWMIDHFHQSAYEDWLSEALLRQAVTLPVREFERFTATAWRPKRWPWVDPLKDIGAAEKARQLRVRSGHRIAEDLGEDWDEVQDEIDAEEARTNSGGTENGAEDD